MPELTLAEHHKFTQGGDVFLYDVQAMRAFRINEALSAELDRLREVQPLTDDAMGPEVRAVLSTLGMLRTEVVRPNPADYIPRKQPLHHITLNVAQLCNLSCIYCYGGDGEYGEGGLMSEETAFRAVDWLLENSLDAEHVSITFFGGEPLLNFPLMQSTVAYARDAAAAAGKTVGFSITTNGTLLTEEITAYLNEHNFAVTISFDGDPEIQNANRPMKGGQGSFDVAKPKIEAFLKSRNGRAMGRATVTSHNADLRRIRHALADVGFRSVGTAVAAMPPEEPELVLAEPAPAPGSGGKRLMLPVLQPTRSKGTFGSFFPQNQAAARVSEQQHQKLLQDLEDQASEALEAIKARKPVSDSHLVDMLRQLKYRRRKFYFCGVGRSMAAVSSSGDIYPCHRFVGQKEMKMGRIDDWDASARDPYLENIGMGHAKCGQCWARSFCGGGCAHESIHYSGSMAEPNPHWCGELHRRVELAISTFNQLDDDDKASLRL